MNELMTVKRLTTDEKRWARMADPAEILRKVQEKRELCLNIQRKNPHWLEPLEEIPETESYWHERPVRLRWYEKPIGAEVAVHNVIFSPVDPRVPWWVDLRFFYPVPGFQPTGSNRDRIDPRREYTMIERRLRLRELFQPTGEFCKNYRNLMHSRYETKLDEKDARIERLQKSAERLTKASQKLQKMKDANMSEWVRLSNKIQRLEESVRKEQAR